MGVRGGGVPGPGVLGPIVGMWGHGPLYLGIVYPLIGTTVGSCRGFGFPILGGGVVK